MGFGAAASLVRLNVRERVSDLAAELVVVGSGFQPAPAFQSASAKAPTFREFLLVEVDRARRCRVQFLPLHLRPLEISGLLAAGWGESADHRSAKSSMGDLVQFGAFWRS